MTAKIGYDEFWDSGHAVEPTVAAENLLSFVEGMSMASHHGRFFAPGGPRSVSSFLNFDQNSELEGENFDQNSELEGEEKDARRRS